VGAVPARQQRWQPGHPTQVNISNKDMKTNEKKFPTNYVECENAVCSIRGYKSAFGVWELCLPDNDDGSRPSHTGE
jgi:hypothetical protein